MSTKFDPTILYEDDKLLVLNKPAGLSIHGSDKQSNGTVADWIIQHYPELRQISDNFISSTGQSFPRAGLVHRLDRNTTGVLLVAKTKETYLELKKMFAARLIEKIYQAIVYGKMKQEAGVIDVPIGRSRKDPRRRVANPRAFGRLRQARTAYRVLECFPHFTYVELKPQTGRTHQLRAHLKSIGFPIVADALYAPAGERLPTIARQALHASSLHFLWQGKPVAFTAPAPEDMLKTLDYLRQTC